MKARQLKNFFEEKGFSVSLHKEDRRQCAELEIWTGGGVDMIINLNPFTVEKFKEYVINFDMDDEIDMHRQDKRYRDAFRISHSVEDFTEYEKMLEEIVSQL